MSLEINKRLLPMKGHYFLYNAATAPVVPFIPVFAKQLGYSANIVGTIYLVLPIVGMLAKPFFGWIGDKFHKQKFLFLLAQLVTAVAFISILLIPAIPSKAEFRCHNGENYLKICPPNFNEISDCTRQQVFESPKNSTFECEAKCKKNDMWATVCDYWKVPGLCSSSENFVALDIPIAYNKVTNFESCVDLLFHNGTVHSQETTFYCPGNKTETPVFHMDCDLKCSDESISDVLSGATDDQVKSSYQFWTFFMLLIVSWAGMAVVVSVGDAICFEMLGDKPQKYGNQRLWGSVGWGSASIISGLLIDKFSEGQVTKNYAVGFYLMGIFILFDMALSAKLKYTQTKMSSNILGDVVEILKSFRVIVFFLWTVAVGLGTAMVWNFLFWHLEDLGGKYGCDYGSSMKTLQGLVMAIQCFGGELPFFFISGKLLKKIGHVNAMSLVLFSFGVRFLCYSLLQNPWYVLPVELLNGLTFGVFYATMASYANIVAPPGTEATMQGLVGAVFEGIGVSTGSYIGGKLMTSLKGSATFRIFSFGAFALFAAHVAIQWAINKIIGPFEMRNEYQQPYNSIATEAFSILDDSDYQTAARK